MRKDDLHRLPETLVAPVDDGACDHLPGSAVPDVGLPATGGGLISLAEVSRGGRVVVYVYPRTGVPDEEPLGGTDLWNAIPGARGCTPQSCAFRDHHRELLELGAAVFGLSTQTTDYQREMVARLHLPFEVLSDADGALARAWRLPTFTVTGEVLLKRFTLILDHGTVAKVFYPVFPPDRNAADVAAWLAAH
jgi:peroxiredoxin